MSQLLARWLELGKASHQELKIQGMNQDLSQEPQELEIHQQMGYRELSLVLRLLEPHRESHQWEWRSRQRSKKEISIRRFNLKVEGNLQL